MKKVLAIAGSDPSGGAGIQADIKIISMLGAHPLTLITCHTIQNSRGVRGFYPISKEVLKEELAALKEEVPYHAIKIGMLGNKEIVKLVIEFLKYVDSPWVILDPVIYSTSGYPLLDKEGIDLLKKELLPIVTLITPNLREAAYLTNKKVHSPRQMRQAARSLIKLGPKNILITGGHLSNIPRDLLYDGKNFYEFSSEKIVPPPGKEFHGTGCLFSSAIAALVAQDVELPDAVWEAKEIVRKSISKYDIMDFKGNIPVNPYNFFQDRLERANVLESLDVASRLISQYPISYFAPEVQSNLGYALPNAKKRYEVAAFVGRFVKQDERLIPVGPPRFGASRHIANVILAAMSKFPYMRSAMNIKYSEKVIKLADKIGFKIASFSREEEPEEIRVIEGASLDWGVRKSIEPLETPPDIIYDEGGMGKEPMIRLLASDPIKIAQKMIKLHEVLEAKKIL